MKEAIQRCAANYSVEVTPTAVRKVSSFDEVAGLQNGTVVNVTFLVGAEIDDTLDVCRRLSQAGMKPVAHVPARSFESLAKVEDYFVRLKEIGVREVLVIGGGAPQPAGSLTETMQILESGLLQKYDFSRVGVGAHPEGHPDVSDDVMVQTLLRKAEWARAHGVDLYYETQFCFTPGPIVEWERRIRGLLTKRLGGGSSLPGVHLGVAGPAKIANLIKFAAMSGVGASTRFVTKYANNVLKLATTSAPDELVAGIAAHQRDEPECLVKHLHYYTFGGLPATLRWANGAAAGDFDLDDQGNSFKVRSL